MDVREDGEVERRFHFVKDRQRFLHADPGKRSAARAVRLLIRRFEDDGDSAAGCNKFSLVPPFFITNSRDSTTQGPAKRTSG